MTRAYAQSQTLRHTLIEDFINRYDESRDALLRWNREEVAAGGRPKEVYDIAFAGKLIADLGQMVERMAKIESMGAITLDVVDRLMTRMVEDLMLVARKYVPDDERRGRLLGEVEECWGSIRLDALKRAPAGD